MAYLRLYDYIANIQSPTLTQLIQGMDSTRQLKENVSQAEIISYLVQKYDTKTEFQNTGIFNPVVAYQANALVELNYPAWVSGSYIVNNLVSYVNNGVTQVYICIQNATTEVPTNTSYWQLVGNQYDLNYIAYPYPVFQLKAFYRVGDRVFWKGQIYQCRIATVILSHISELQDENYANIPLRNVFPDHPISGMQYWGIGTPYTVIGLIPNAPTPAAWSNVTAYTAGTRVLSNGLVWRALLNNTNVSPGADIVTWQSETWTFGDNRNAQIVECMTWITIEKLSPLISPRNIPELWARKYTEYLTWLQMCAQGDVTLDMPKIQPARGARIRFGGDIKQNNGY